MNELGKVVGQLREALEEVESATTQEPIPLLAIEEFRFTVDTVRTSVLAMVTSVDAADYSDVLRDVRLRRTAQVCQNILPGLLDGTIDSNTPGTQSLRLTIGEVLQRLERVTQLP